MCPPKAHCLAFQVFKICMNGRMLSTIFYNSPPSFNSREVLALSSLVLCSILLCRYTTVYWSVSLLLNNESTVVPASHCWEWCSHEPSYSPGLICTICNRFYRVNGYKRLCVFSSRFCQIILQNGYGN